MKVLVPMHPNTQHPTRALLLFLFVSLCIIVPFLLWGDAITTWFNHQMHTAAQHPILAGLILLGLLSSDILLPVPSSLASTCCGMILGLVPGFLVSFFAMTISAVLGYCLGRFATRWATRAIGEKDMQFLSTFLQKRTRWWILLLRPVPVLAEASILFAGIARTSPRRVTQEALLGNAIVSAAYATVGALGQSSDSMLPAFVATMLISALCMCCVKKQKPM